ncbi:MAG: AraC family transcriptional regulator [Phaeodactylibacter sp.]|nr:AraC family transcriptional regulator [Phaeodactylibacter sp.]
MERNGFWASMPLVRNIALVAVRRGAALESVCQAIGLSPEALENPEAIARLDQCIKAWEQALYYTGDPFLGLHLGEATSPGLVGMVGYFMESSPGLCTAFRNLVEFKKLFDSASSWVEERGEAFFYHMEPDPLWKELSPETARHVFDHGLSAILNFIKLLTGKAIYPVLVVSPFPRPEDTREYLRVLKTEPLFNQDGAFIEFRLRDIQAPLIGHNPVLNSIFKSLLEEALAKANASSFSNEVRRVILQKFGSSIPQLPQVAELLHITPRTLQRRLKEEGATFQRIVDSVKSELAIGLLQKPGLTVSEIAWKLGYVEPNVFRRAFRKWTGKSPRAYRMGA